MRHTRQNYVSQRLLDSAGAVRAGVIFGFQVLESIVEIGRVFQIRSKVVRLDFANTVHVAYLGVVRIDDFPVIVEKRFRLFEERAESASQVIASSIAAVELHFAFRTGQSKRFGLCRFIAGGKGASESRAGIDDR